MNNLVKILKRNLMTYHTDVVEVYDKLILSLDKNTVLDTSYVGEGDFFMLKSEGVNKSLHVYQDKELEQLVVQLFLEDTILDEGVSASKIRGQMLLAQTNSVEGAQCISYFVNYIDVPSLKEKDNTVAQSFSEAIRLLPDGSYSREDIDDVSHEIKGWEALSHKDDEHFSHIVYSHEDDNVGLCTINHVNGEEYLRASVRLTSANIIALLLA